MTKTYELTESDVPAHHTSSVYADIVADFLVRDVPSMKVTIEDVKPATLRAGRRRAEREGS